MAATAAGEAAAPGEEEAAAGPVLLLPVQYVVVRRDLYETMGWPRGSVIAQACHAATAALWLHRDDPATLQYVAPEHLDSMHKARGGLAFPCFLCAPTAEERNGTVAAAPQARKHKGQIESRSKSRQVVLEIKGEAQLRALADKLAAAGVGHKLWMEQPENIPTCLATKPVLKAEAGVHFKKFQLCK